MKHRSLEQIEGEVISDPIFGAAVEFLLGKIGDVQNKVILDSGCGSGKMSVFFALKGANVIGIDKDSACIDRATKLAHSCGVQSNCLFLQGYSESTTIDSCSIDIVFSKSTIQYMERERVLNEYIRILKPRGSLALIENLPHNPLINLYRLHRRLFCRIQQEMEYVNSIRGYITLREIQSLASRFHYSEHHEHHLLRIVSIYLRLYSRQNFLAKELDVLLSSVDGRILSLFPSLKYLAWFTVLYCQEKNAYKSQVQTTSQKLAGAVNGSRLDRGVTLQKARRELNHPAGRDEQSSL